MTVPQALPSLIAAIAAVACGWMVYKNSRRANAQSMSATQLQWVQQAMNEATAAKSDAQQAKTDARQAEAKAQQAEQTARSATARAEDFERRMRQVEMRADEFSGWIVRVVRTAEPIAEAGHPDPAVANLLRVINGGPAGISNANLRRG